jgi:cbb3-type cytochrome oxidase subunit 3
MIDILRGAVTLALFSLFIIFALWAWSGRRKELFDAMARMPLEEDAEPKSRSEEP